MWQVGEAPAVMEARRQLSCLRAFGTWRWLPGLARVSQHTVEARSGLRWNCCDEGATHMQQVETRGSTAGEAHEGALGLGDECWQVVLVWVVVLCSRLRLQWRCWGVQELDLSSGEEEAEDRKAAASEQEDWEVEEGTTALCCWLGGGDGAGRTRAGGCARCAVHGSSSVGGGVSRCRCWRAFLPREVGVVGLVGSALRELVPRLVGRVEQLQGAGGGKRQEAAEETLWLVAGAAILVAREFWDEPELQAALQPAAGGSVATSSNGGVGRGHGEGRTDTLRGQEGSGDRSEGSNNAAACANPGSADGRSRQVRDLRSQVSTSSGEASCYDSCCGTADALTPDSSLLSSLNRSGSPSGALPSPQPEAPLADKGCALQFENPADLHHLCPRPWPAEGLKALAQHFRAGGPGGGCVGTGTWAEPGCSVLEKMCRHKHKKGAIGGDGSVRQRQQEQLLEFAAGGCAAWLGQAGEQVPWLCELRALLRPCSNPRCVVLPPEDVTEADAEQQQVVCGVCGIAWYCCRECRAAHWRAGHREQCAAPSPVGTPTAAGMRGMGPGWVGAACRRPSARDTAQGRS